MRSLVRCRLGFFHAENGDIFMIIKALHYMKMRVIIRLLLSFVVIEVAVSCATHASVSGNWKLVWQDNFNQSGSFDTTKWSKIDRGWADWDNYMSHYDGCYDMRKGNIVLRGMVNPDTQSDTAKYITGGVTTMGKKVFQNGLIEIRAKLQGARGAWPAIWMLPEEGSWPDGGEIDIMERLNSDDIAYQTIHTHYTYTLNIREEPLSHSTGAINPNDYNVYSAELHRDSITFYINGKKTFSYPRIKTDKQGQFPFDRPYYLLVDMQLGGSWVGQVNAADLPIEMLVDYVRFYQRPEQIEKDKSKK